MLAEEYYSSAFRLSTVILATEYTINSKIRPPMIHKIYRVIYLSCIIVIWLGLFCFLLGIFFFDNYKNYPTVEKVASPLILITSFALIGTLFDTLKESQSPRKKLIVILLTGLGVLFLLTFVWGILVAAAFD
jgi:hypothetical protein